MKIIFFYNSKSGTIKESPELLDIITKQIEAVLKHDDSFEKFDVRENDPGKIIRQNNLTEEDRILIAGGDGTISSVIDKTVDFQIPYGILPLGTFNNFSKCIGMSQYVEESVEQFLSGKVKSVDVGKVNGRIMINNSSVGIYPKLVAIREDHQIRFGLGKPLAMIISFIKSMLLFPLIHVSLESDGKKISALTPFVMVGNNRYELNLFEIGERKSLNEGLLYVYFIKCRTRLCVMRVLLKALFDNLDMEKDFELISTKKAELKIRKHKIRAACDGEIFITTPPLRYQICTSCVKIVYPNNYE